MTRAAAGRQSRSRPRWRPRGIYLALGLLTLCTVFAAAVGVRQALASATRAVRATVAAAPAAQRTITASTSWATINQAALMQSNPATFNLIYGQVPQVTSSLRDLYGKTVPLAPASAAWASMTSTPTTLTPTPAATKGVSVELEVTGLTPLTGHTRLVAGSLPGTPGPAVQPGPSAPPVPGVGNSAYVPAVPVAVTSQTATRFGLKPGSKVALDSGAITLEVTGIVQPTDPGSPYWTTDAAVAAPQLQQPMDAPPYWVGSVIAGPQAAEAVQQDFGPSGLALKWTLPMALGQLTGQQAGPLSGALTRISAQTTKLPGPLATVGAALAVASSLVPVLTAYSATSGSVEVVLWLLFVSLFVTVLAVLLLAARMITLRRSAELALFRARGASSVQVALAAGGNAAVACIPAAVVALALAYAVVPGAGGPFAGSGAVWWPAAAVLILVAGGPALIAVWQHRLPRRRAGVARRAPRGRTRLVVEAALILAAVAGIVLFRHQATAETGSGTGVNFFASAAPVLVAVPVVIIVLRLYPLVLRGLVRLAARSAGAPAFLGLSRAARGRLTPALPVFGLVLALSVAAFGGMVRDAVTQGDVTASWQTAGADVTVSETASAVSALPAAGLKAASTVPGVTSAAQVWASDWTTPGDTALTVLAVDPAAYAALTASSAGYPPVAAGLIAPTAAGTAQPVLASPRAAADLGQSPVALSAAGNQAKPVTVRVAGTVSATPGLPGGGAFVIVPFGALTSTVSPPPTTWANRLLLNGAGIDRTRLSTVLRADLPGTAVTDRSDVLAGLAGAPLQHGAFELITLGTVVAACLGLAVMLLELALSAGERRTSLARLAAMGLTDGQQARVAALELLPALLAAAVGALACALALPSLLGPAVNLSAFSTSAGSVPLRPNVLSVVLPLLALIVLAAVALGTEIRAARRHSAANVRRVGA